MGAFPDARRPEVVWAGFGAGSEGWMALASALEAELLSVGLPREPRPFAAHLTLARRRRATPAAGARTDVATLVARYGRTQMGDLAARSVTLFQSELGPGGARYTVLEQVPLAPAAVGRVP